MNLILASASPRRKELLEFLGYAFEVKPANVDENVYSNEKALDYVLRVCRDKCSLISVSSNDCVVLAADTSVVLGSDILGKPIDLADSNRMLVSLSGKRHRVLTAFSIYNPVSKEIKSEVVESVVSFRVLSLNEIELYSDSREGFDKAGGYGFQNSALSFISSIEGSPSNIIGLPLAEVKMALDKVICLI